MITPFDNPEERPLSQRCLLGFGSTSGPPAPPDYFYNDMHQVVSFCEPSTDQRSTIEAQSSLLWAPPACHGGRF